jgi:ubiquinone/menaquinone biosynthesis C-methylase UbiE
MPEVNKPETNEDEFSFSAFSNLPFYRDVNARLIDLSGIAKRDSIIDLGCGTGGVTKLILERVQAAREGLSDRVQAAREGLGDRVQAAREGLQAAREGLSERVQAARETVIYAVDHSASALRAAMADLGSRREAAVRFIQAEAQQLQTAVRDQVDAIIYCNSIHYVPDKAGLVAQLRTKLRPGGVLAINTSFFEGSHPPATEEFYRRWMFRSLRILKREYGLSPDRSQKVEARKHLTAEEYEALLNGNGFQVTKKDLTNVEVPIDGWHHISGFSDWIQGIMPGVPLDRGRAALQQGLREVFAEMQIKSVPRTWLSLTAIRAI